LDFLLTLPYDLTNLATLKNWSIKVVIVDVLWGMILCGAVATSFFQVENGCFNFFKKVSSSYF